VTAVIDGRARTGAPAVTSLQFPPYSGAAAMRLTAAGTLSTRPIVTVYITYKMNLKNAANALDCPRLYTPELAAISATRQAAGSRQDAPSLNYAKS